MSSAVRPSAAPTLDLDPSKVLGVLQSVVPSLLGWQDPRLDDSVGIAPKADAHIIGNSVGSVFPPMQMRRDVAMWNAMTLILGLEAIADPWDAVDVGEAIADYERSANPAITSFREQTALLLAQLDAGHRMQVSDETRRLAGRVAAERKQRAGENIKSWARGLIHSIYSNR